MNDGSGKSAFTDAPRLRQEFEELASLLDVAMNDPAMQATPHASTVLHLLGQGLLVLSRAVVEHLEETQHKTASEVTHE